MFPSRRIINRKNFLFIVFTFVLFLAAFQYIFYLMREECGLSTILDLYFHYSADEAYSLLNYYGHGGRTIYLWGLLLDTVFPVIYGLFLWMSITYLSERIHLSKSTIRFLQLLPFAAVGFDYVENIFEIWMTLGYPNAVKRIAPICSWITSLKWVLIYSNIFVLVFLVLIYVFGMNTRTEK